MKQHQPKSIFLTDDDEDDCFFFREALMEVSANINLRTANGCQQLLDTLHQSNQPSPDLIVMDVNMSRKNGLDCLADLKLTDALKNIPVIIFSTSSHRKSVEDSMARGAHCYIKKPNSFERLKMVLKEVLRMDLSRPLLDNFFRQF